MGKKQGKNHNISVLIAKGYAFHGQCHDTMDSLQDEQQLLIFRLVHTRNCEQVLATPMVMSYLMGWGDIYCSHHYTPIFWSLFTGAILREFPNRGLLYRDYRESTGSPLGVEWECTSGSCRWQIYIDSQWTPSGVYVYWDSTGTPTKYYT